MFILIPSDLYIVVSFEHFYTTVVYYKPLQVSVQLTFI